MRATQSSYLLALAALAFLALGAAAVTLARAPASPKSLPRIGVLLVDAPNGGRGFIYDGLKALGYAPNKNIDVERRVAHGRDERLDAFAAELVHDKVQVILAQNASSALAAQRATRTIPIVFVSISDPVAVGLVQSLARPGGNITGIANTPNDLNQKRIEILKDALPGLRRIGILARAGNPNTEIHLSGEIAAAQRLNLEARIYSVAGPDEFDSVFAAMNRDDAQAVVVVQDSVFFIHRQQLMNSAIEHGLPVIADGIEYADSSALMTYGSSYRAIYARGVVYVDRILHGAKPEQLPVDQPMDLRLIVNLNVAQRLGITISSSFLVRANEVLE